MQEYKVKDHVSSFLPEGKKWKLSWSDEFDGTELDRTKWDFRLHIMQKRHKTWQDDGVYLDGNSNLVFKIYEKDGVICSSQLQTGANFTDAPRHEEDHGIKLHEDEDMVTKLVWPLGKLQEPKHLHLYGYYECRCKMQKKPGWWTAFWLQSPIQGATLDPAFSGTEIDIMESFTPGKIGRHAVHYNGCGADYKGLAAGDGVMVDVDEWHTFGLLWEKDKYTFYVDGKVDGVVTGPISQTPQFILLSTEVNGYRDAERDATDEARAAVGDTFTVDYVRVFDEVE